MEDGLLASQWKKLAMVGAFLLGVAALVGEEDDPGVLARTAEAEASVALTAPSEAPPPAASGPRTIAKPNPVAQPPRPVENTAPAPVFPDLPEEPQRTPPADEMPGEDAMPFEAAPIDLELPQN